MIGKTVLVRDSKKDYWVYIWDKVTISSRLGDGITRYFVQRPDNSEFELISPREIKQIT